MNTLPKKSTLAASCKLLLVSLALGSANIANALELTRIGEPVKMADASSYSYAYAPSIIKSNGQWHAYFCSAGAGIGDWDHVRYAASPDLIHWGPVIDLIQSTGFERANCDPSVVRFDAGDGLFYYMAYSGNVVNMQTANFIARSESPTGPFLKLTKRGTWERAPADSKIIAAPKVPAAEGSNIYGAGQPSLVVKDGKIYQFFTDVTASPSGIYLSTSDNMKDWTAPVYAGLDGGYASVDVKYDDAMQEFVVVDNPFSHSAAGIIRLRSSKDGLSWGASKTICDQACTPDFSHNVGMSGDESGHIFGDELLVGYGAPYNLGPTDQWGKWHLWATRFKMIREGQVKGVVDAIGSNPVTVDGWACALKRNDPIEVHLYAGGPVGVGTMIGGVKADRPSEPGIAQACEAGGAAYRFTIPLTAEILRAHAGKQVFVHGISPVGGANNVIDNPESLKLPSEGRSVVSAPAASNSDGYQPLGFFRLGNDPTVYFSNGDNAYCAYGSGADFFAAGGASDFSNVVSRAGGLPTNMQNHALCKNGNTPAPAAIPSGFVQVGDGGILLSNGVDAYCGIPSWGQYLLRGGRTDMGNVTKVTEVPTGLRNDGECPAAE